MDDINIQEKTLTDAAQKGSEAFVEVIVEAIQKAVGEELTAEKMARFSADQLSLLAYWHLREEVMEGGFIQLIYNGWGSFIFQNPFSNVLKSWNMEELSRMIDKCHRLFSQYRGEIERGMSDEEFMALYEELPKFEKFDDDFVENESRWTDEIARYVDEHIDEFVTMEKQ